MHINKLARKNKTCSYKKKGRDMTQSYDKRPYTNRNVKVAK